MIDFFKNKFLWKIIAPIIVLVAIACSYIPMMRNYELYVQSEDLIYALVGGVAIFLVYYIWHPKKPLLYLLWIIVGVIYFYSQTIYFEGKILRASTIISIVGSIALLAPFIVLSLKKKKAASIKRPDVYLGRARAYNRIHFRIRRMMLDSEGKAIALYGRWGIGKTHCIQFLSHRLQKEFDRKEFDDNVTRDLASPLNEAFDGSVEICNISLWNYKTVDEAWTAVINKLYYTITGSRVIDVQGFLSRLTKILPKGEFLEALINYIWLPHGNQNDDWSGVISAEIGKERRVLLIFDDIERAPYEIIRNLLPLIERLKAIDGLIVLCAITDDELVKVYQEHNVDEDSLHGYLSKIFDFSFELPQASYHAIRGMEAKLIEKRYKDFPLLTAFFEFFKLKYDTPRQIERIAEKLSSIELQYLYDATLLDMDDYYAKYEQKEFCIFLVEIIRLFYKPILVEINNNGVKLLTLSETLSNIESRNLVSNNTSSNDYINEKENFKKTYPVTANYISSDSFVGTILQRLSHYKPTVIQSAIIMDYARRLTLSPRECDDIVHLKDSHEEMNVKELILTYFKNDPTCLDSIDMAIHDLIDHCIENAYKASHAHFLNYIYVCDPPDDEFRVYGSTNFHNNNKDRFIHLLNTCGYYMNKVESKNSICSAIKSFIWHCHLFQIYPYLCKLIHSNKIEYPWYGEKYFLENQTLKLIRDSNLINEIIILYSERMISFIFTDSYTNEISRESNTHEAYHFYDNPIFERAKPIIQNIISNYLLNTSHKESNLYKILVYLLCEAAYDKYRGIFAIRTSKWIVDTFKPWLNECLQTVHPSEIIINEISGWIEKINESRELWSQKTDSKEYVDGATELLSIMEMLQKK